MKYKRSAKIFVGVVCVVIAFTFVRPSLVESAVGLVSQASPIPSPNAETEPSTGVEDNQATPTPIDFCVQEVVAKAGLDSRTNSTAENYDVARCLIANRHMAEARTLLIQALHSGYDPDLEKGVTSADLYWQLALAEEHLGMKSESIKHIVAANSATMEFLEKHGHEIALDYRRINRVALEAQRRASAKSAAAARQADVLSSQHDWDNMSNDQRSIMRRYGGTGNSNNNTLLCHTESYTASGYRRETWWFCNYSGSYEHAYTFTNGRLTSIYDP